MADPAPSGRRGVVYRASFLAGLAVLLASFAAGFGQVLLTQGRPPGLSRAPFEQAEAALRGDDLARAAREYRMGALVNPADYAIQLGAADGLARSRDLPGALQVLDRAERLRPQQARTESARGWAYLLNGRPAPAFAAFASALRRDERDARALAGVGEILLQQGRNEEAVRALARSVAIDPAMAATRDALGLALALAGRPGPAVEQFRSALALEPTAQRQANLERALSHAQGGAR